MFGFKLCSLFMGLQDIVKLDFIHPFYRFILSNIPPGHLVE